MESTTIIDFSVYETHDPRVMSIMDYSMWGLIEDKPAIIEITPAGFNKPVTYYFQKNKTNVFNTYSLHLQAISACGLSDLSELPDGIYKITVKGSPDTYSCTKHYLRTTKFQLELDKAYINLNLNCNDVDKKKEDSLLRVEMLIKAAEANTRHSNICEAQELFMKAKELFNELNKSTC